MLDEKLKRSGATHVAHCNNLRKVAFTLAEVLITLGIIGVVAALTLPTLIDKYKKQVYYAQFMKAATSIENAYNSLCNSDNGYDCKHLSIEKNWDRDFIKYFNVVVEINKDNAEKVCGGYNKLPLEDEEGRKDWINAAFVCDSEYFQTFGFITNDSILILFPNDWGYGNGGLIDTNGPDKGPNQFGRDVFVFYPYYKDENYDSTYQLWGDSNRTSKCPDIDNNDSCGLRLLQDGKMNY